jgi:hypothetical protein
MRWVRYAYFMRFSLGLWLFALILCWLNSSPARTLTSGIMTPETIQQYACVGFFLMSAGADQRAGKMGQGVRRIR